MHRRLYEQPSIEKFLIDLCNPENWFDVYQSAQTNQLFTSPPSTGFKS